MRRSSDPPIVLVKWYDPTKWILERVDSFPKNQRFIFGQRLADRALTVLELLVEAAYSKNKQRLLERANREIEVLSISDCGLWNELASEFIAKPLAPRYVPMKSGTTRGQTEPANPSYPERNLPIRPIPSSSPQRTYRGTDSGLSR